MTSRMETIYATGPKWDPTLANWRPTVARRSCSSVVNGWKRHDRQVLPELTERVPPGWRRHARLAQGADRRPT
jgi:hypothetical protein